MLYVIIVFGGCCVLEWISDISIHVNDLRTFECGLTLRASSEKESEGTRPTPCVPNQVSGVSPGTPAWRALPANLVSTDQTLCLHVLPAQLTCFPRARARRGSAASQITNRGGAAAAGGDLPRGSPPLPRRLCCGCLRLSDTPESPHPPPTLEQPPSHPQLGPLRTQT